MLRQVALRSARLQLQTLGAFQSEVISLEQTHGSIVSLISLFQSHPYTANAVDREPDDPHVSCKKLPPTITQSFPDLVYRFSPHHCPLYHCSILEPHLISSRMPRLPSLVRPVGTLQLLCRVGGEPSAEACWGSSYST